MKEHLNHNWQFESSFKKVTGEKRDQVLRDFGLLMALAFSVISALLLWREKLNGFYTFFVAAVFLLLGIFYPRALSLLEKAWMKFAAVLSIVTTRIILVLSFYLMFLPMALVLKILRRDLLSLRLDPEAKTYWVPVEKDGPGSRHYLPY